MPLQIEQSRPRSRARRRDPRIPVSSSPQDSALGGDGVFGLSLECEQRLGKTSAGLSGPCMIPGVYSDAGTLAIALESEADVLARAGRHTRACYL